MKRGEIWTVAGAGYAGKPRPALIMQDDSFTGMVSVTIIPLTSHITGLPQRALIEPSANNGLKLPSRAMMDKINTVPRTAIGIRVGAVSESDMAAVEASLIMFLGIGGEA